MKSLPLIATLIIAFIFDRIWGQIAAGIFPPFVIMVALFWMVKLDYRERIALAFILGSILDTLSFLPQGAYSLMLAASALLSWPIRQFFDNTESRLVTLLHTSILVALFRFAAPFVALFTVWASRIHL